MRLTQLGPILWTHPRPQVPRSRLIICFIMFPIPVVEPLRLSHLNRSNSVGFLGYLNKGPLGLIRINLFIAASVTLPFPWPRFYLLLVSIILPGSTTFFLESGPVTYLLKAMLTGYILFSYFIQNPNKL